MRRVVLSRITLKDSLLMAGLLVPTLLSSGLDAAERFTSTYRNGTRCASSYKIEGREPTAAGKYPVFIFAVGTTEAYDNAMALAAIEALAERGYVAASLQYPNMSFGLCGALSDKASCMFDPASANSAVSKLCARSKADCGRGILVAGFSQGSIMAILARNYDARVQAAYGMGAGVQYLSYDLRACLTPDKRALPTDRLRAVNGEADDFMGQNATSVRNQLQELTGLTCTSSAYSCLRSNASGWVMASHAEVEDGKADHCYARDGGCSLNQNDLDIHWETGAGGWTLDPNLEWLTGFTQ